MTPSYLPCFSIGGPIDQRLTHLEHIRKGVLEDEDPCYIDDEDERFIDGPDVFAAQEEAWRTRRIPDNEIADEDLGVN